MQSRAPSGLFPSGPPRPAFREPHQVRMGAVLAGSGVSGAWLLLVWLLAPSTYSYVWLTMLAAAVAWLAALVLAQAGDRGIAVGVALTTGLGMAVAVGVVVLRWATIGWPPW